MESIHGILHLLNKSLFLLCLLCCMMFLTACTKNNSKHSYTNNTSETISSESTNEDLSTSELDGKYYRVYTGNQPEDHFYYYFDLLDSSGNVLLNQCTYMAQPTIEMITDSIIKVSAQPGTGRGSRWTFYYDLKSKIQSPAHFYVLSESSNLIAYFDGEQIVVQDMFDKGKYTKKIALKKDLSNGTDPIESVSFSDDLSKINVTYFSGTNFQEINEMVRLK